VLLDFYVAALYNLGFMICGSHSALSLTLWEPAYDIFVLRFRPKKQQFLVALPTP